jgi:hypothetical protein
MIILFSGLKVVISIEKIYNLFWRFIFFNMHDRIDLLVILRLEMQYDNIKDNVSIV